MFVFEIHLKPVRHRNDQCVRAKAFSAHKACIYHIGRGIFQERVTHYSEEIYIFPFCNEDFSENLGPVEII